jgi:hypothetical protein
MAETAKRNFVVVVLAKPAGTIIPMGDEPHLSFRRPPHLKADLSGAVDRMSVLIKSQPAYDKANIQSLTL